MDEDHRPEGDSMDPVDLKMDTVDLKGDGI